MNLTLYNRVVPGEPPGPANNRLLESVLGGDPPQPYVSAAHAGDTLNITLYFLDEGTAALPYVPFKNHRYAGSTVSVRLRAQGNNTIYANTTAVSEIVADVDIAGRPTGIPYASRIQSGSELPEQHRVQFPSVPQTGSFKMVYSGPSEGIYQGGVGPKGTSSTIYVRDGAAGIQAALRAMPLYKWVNNPPTRVTGDWTNYIFVTGPMDNLVIEYHRGAPSNAQGRPGIVPLPAFTTEFDVQYAWGWQVTVPLTAGNFTELFHTSKGPAYLEVLLDGTVVAQHQLDSNVTPGQAPVADFSANVINGPPGASITFQDESSNAPTSWAWNFGDPASGGANTSTQRNPSHTYAAAGVYTVSLTATNATGSDAETKTGYIIISTFVPPEVVGGVIYDGDFDVAHMVGAPSISHGLPDDSNSLIWRQRYHQSASKWQPLAIGMQNCPFHPAAIAVDETALQWLGVGDVVEFERVWALKPAERTRPGSYSKTYKKQVYIVTGGQIDPTTYSIASRTAVIDADFKYKYFNIVSEEITIPAIMDISVIHMGQFHDYELYGGFPAPTASVAGSNHGYTLIGVDTRPYMGPIWERLLVYG